MDGPLDAQAELIVALNLAALNTELEANLSGKIADAPPVIARCQVQSGDGRLVFVDLNEIVAQHYGSAPTPSRHVCVTRLALVESKNEKEVDMAFRCNRPVMLPPNCHIARSQNSVQIEASCLLAACSKTHTVHSPPHPLFVLHQREPDFYAKYAGALEKELETMVTPTRGGCAMEYLSHKLVINEKEDGSTELLRGDWLLRIIAANQHAFSSPVTCHRLPAREEDVHCSKEVEGTKQNCSFVFDVQDWRNLYEAVNDSVLRPLQDRVVYLDDPTGASQTVGFNIDTVGEPARTQNGLGVASAPERPGNVYALFEIEMKFV